jgi:hypothetical protein
MTRSTEAEDVEARCRSCSIRLVSLRAPFLDLSAVNATPHDHELGQVELGLGEWLRLKGTHLRGAQRGTSLPQEGWRESKGGC